MTPRYFLLINSMPRVSATKNDRDWIDKCPSTRQIRPRVWDSPSDAWPPARNLERFLITWNYVTGGESLKFREWEHVGVEKGDQLFRDMLRGSIGQSLAFLPGSLQCFLTRHRYGHSSPWGRPIWDDSWAIL
jgi:hypothetical protein